MHICLAIPELILNIAEQISCLDDLSRFSRTCRSLRIVSIPLLLREISIPLRHAGSVRELTRKVPFFKCHKLEILGKSRYEEVRWCTGMSTSRRQFEEEEDEEEAEDDDVIPKTFLKWCSALTGVLQDISRGGALHHFAIVMGLVPAYVPQEVWDALSLSSPTLETLRLKCWEESDVDDGGEPWFTSHEYTLPDAHPNNPFPVLRSLIIHVQSWGDDYDDDDDDLWDVDWIESILDGAPHIEHFSFSHRRDYEDLLLDSCHPSLKGFEFFYKSNAGECAAFIQSNPQLERLHVASQPDLRQAGLPPFTDLRHLKALWNRTTSLWTLDESRSLIGRLLHLRIPGDHLKLVASWPWSTFQLRCLELTMRDHDLDIIMQTLSSVCKSAYNLREIGLLLWEDEYLVREGSSAATAIAGILEAVQEAPQLSALHIESWDESSYARKRLNIGQLLPPRLRYLLWVLNGDRAFYEIRTKNGGCVAVKVSEPSLRVARSDWTGESVYHHLADNLSF